MSTCRQNKHSQRHLVGAEHVISSCMYLIVGPGGVTPPFVVVLNGTSLEITWKPPIEPNGKLQSYIISLPIPTQEISNTNINSVIISDLIPDTQYMVTVTACSGIRIFYNFKDIILIIGHKTDNYILL